ncbi:YaaL family protein [Viridibacillus sp. YIM B01967]|uniref:YaaL family protein n=1 Tax=Viridibacillus soli TaxID=2798301 RepID=A0ABS1HD12_9BACL|nr:YaaL family protein [Viridibacillus soli]MBK3497308.1 YaaL family protein [Viridibacillus soli]
MFFRKQKLRKEFDEKLVVLMRETKGNWQQTQEIEGLLDDYDLETIVQRKIAESKHFYLFKEARIRKILLR